jgi:hypothetical protein
VDRRFLHQNLSTDFWMNWPVENSAVMVSSAVLSALYQLALVEMCPGLDASWWVLDVDHHFLHQNLSTDFWMNWPVENFGLMVLSAVLSALYQLALVEMCPS